MSVLELRDLHITYRSERGYVPAVRGVDLEIGPGETVGLAGESGCGKSTIAASVLRLLPKSAEVTGRVILDGEDVYAMKPGRLRAVRWTRSPVSCTAAKLTFGGGTGTGSQRNSSRTVLPRIVGELRPS